MIYDGTATDQDPPPMAWEEYAERALAEYTSVLNTDVGEERMQRVLEKHPPLVPHAFPLGGHGALFDVLITQPPLKGYGGRVPDFMWLTRNSGELRPVLIEIEAPEKRYLSGPAKDRRPSADLGQALNQFRQWREWFEESGNVEVFLDTYGIEGKFRPPRRRFVPVYLLIYGRADEGEEAAKLRSRLRQELDAEILTFDSLEPRSGQASYITASSLGKGKFKAEAMPACARLEPTYPDWWLSVEGHAEMIERNHWISAERKARLLELVPEWDEWARKQLVREARNSSEYRAQRRK